MTKRAKYHKALTVYTRMRRAQISLYREGGLPKEDIYPKRNAKECYKYYKDIYDNYKRDNLDFLDLMYFVEACAAIK